MAKPVVRQWTARDGLHIAGGLIGVLAVSAAIGAILLLVSRLLPED